MSLKERLANIKKRIEESLLRSNRVEDKITLIAVTKTHPVNIIEELYKEGIIDIGENYVQEMMKKMEIGLPIRWHFIGGLQKNKVKYLVGKVYLIHSLDNFPLAEEIDKRAKSKGVIQNVLLQINQGEETKGGIKVNEAEDFIKKLNNFSNIRLLGLMGMPPFLEEKEKVRPYFKELRELIDDLNSKNCYKETLKELSMGMSSDFEVAIEEGSTMIRIGTALLGERGRKAL